jgi:hypothetical protein
VKYEYGLWPIVVFHVVWLLGFALTFLRPARRGDRARATPSCLKGAS